MLTSCGHIESSDLLVVFHKCTARKNCVSRLRAFVCRTAAAKACTVCVYFYNVICTLVPFTSFFLPVHRAIASKCHHKLAFTVGFF